VTYLCTNTCCSIVGSKNNFDDKFKVEQHRITEKVIHNYKFILNKSASHSAVFFSHNKSANSTLSYDFSAKRTGLYIIHTHKLKRSYNNLTCNLTLLYGRCYSLHSKLQDVLTFSTYITFAMYLGINNCISVGCC
jgi:hypothetical protein